MSDGRRRMMRLRGRGGGGERPAREARALAPAAIPPEDLGHLFAAPRWLRSLGRTSWLLVGIAGILVGLVWILGVTSSIVEPVVAGGVVAAVASPGVAWLARHRVPRPAGAGLMLLALLAIAALIVLLVLGGLVEQSAQIERAADDAMNTIEGWVNDADVNGTSGTAQDVKSAVSAAGGTLLQGVAGGIDGLTSLAFFLSFTLFSLFFLLKDGPVVKRWVDRHLGVPEPVARLVTSEVLNSLRRYFLGVTIVAAFNAVVVGAGALILGVPLAGTIAVVVFVTAYIPFIGAFISGAFAVVIALGSEGSTTALIMLIVVVLANGMLQQVVQPIAFGATLDLNPLAVLVVTIGAGSLFGMVGLVLAAPLTSAAVHVSRRLALERAADTGEAGPGPTPQPAPGGGGPPP
jgi:putative heme transporter